MEVRTQAKSSAEATDLFLVVLYTAVGGLKATFITDYIHTTIALILIIWFTLGVLMSDTIGGIYGLYEKVLAAEAAGQYYIEGNYMGSLLTFKSKGAFEFGVIHSFGNLALMTMVFSPLISFKELCSHC